MTALEFRVRLHAIRLFQGKTDSVRLHDATLYYSKVEPILYSKDRPLIEDSDNILLGRFSTCTHDMNFASRTTETLCEQDEDS